MELLAKLQDDMKTAMKAGDKTRLSVIRMLISDVKNIDLLPNKPSAEAVVEAYGKRLRKSRDEFEKLGRSEQVTELNGEIAIVDLYLPKKLSPQETQMLVDTFVASEAYNEKQVGQAISAFMKQYGNTVDPKVASDLIRGKLSA